MSTATLTAIETFRSQLQHALIDAYPTLMERLAWDRERLLAHQRQHLRALLRTAVAGSPFHARRLAGIDPDAVDPADLSALPVMTKAEMMEELDDVFTDRRLTRADVEVALAATTNAPRPIHDRYIAFTSGGSSGVRGVYVYDVPALVGFLGPLTRVFATRAQAMGGLTSAMLGARSAVHPTGAGPALCAGEVLPFSFVGVPVTDPLPDVVAALEEQQAPVLYGYATMLARLAEEQRAGRLRIAPAMVTSTSETLTPELRATIREGFGVPIVNSYATTEGLSGASEPDGDVVVLSEDTSIVEVEEDRVLVTNLCNHVQPLIRYELRDVLTVVSDDGLLRVRVQGRQDEILRWGAVEVHPLVVRSELVRTPAVFDYQVRQTRGGIDVDVLAQGTLDDVDLRHRLAAALAAAGFARADVTVRAVAGLGRDPATGKLARFVPLRPA